MIISALVFLLAVVIFMAGVFSTATPWMTILLTIPAGLLLTAIHHFAWPSECVHEALNGELTLGQFRRETAKLPDHLVMYSSHPISFINYWFCARLGEHKAIILERSE